MFNSQNVGERGGSRPLVVGLILLLLFLSTAQDWGTPPRSGTRSQLKGGHPRDVARETKEVIIRNLVKSNEDLEKENDKLRLELFRLRSELKTRRSMNEDETEEAEEKLTEAEGKLAEIQSTSTVSASNVEEKIEGAFPRNDTDQGSVPSVNATTEKETSVDISTS